MSRYPISRGKESLFTSSRARRRLFAAKIELTDVASGAQFIGNTTNLSHSGCRLNQTRLPVGSKVQVYITYRGGVFVAFGRIVRVDHAGEAGIAFTKIEPKDRATLDNWLAQARDANGGQTAHICVPQVG